MWFRRTTTALLGVVAVALGLDITERVRHVGASQRRFVEDLVRSYITEHPELIRDAAAALEKREADEREHAQTAAIASADSLLSPQPGETILGNPHGSTRNTVFTDYNCPYCRKSFEDLEEIERNDPDVQIVIKEFPVLSPQSAEASRIVLAANTMLDSNVQRATLHAELMKLRGPVDEKRALAFAQQLGLNAEVVKQASTQPAISQIIAANLRLGDQLGVNGTPAFVVGAKLVSGAVGADELRRAAGLQDRK